MNNMENVSFFYALLAYIGPGMAGGLIAAITGIIIAFFLGLVSILYFPIKRALKKIKKVQKLKKNSKKFKKE